MEKNHTKISVRTTSVPAEIQTRHTQNTSLENYH